MDIYQSVADQLAVPRRTAKQVLYFAAYGGNDQRGRIERDPHHRHVEWRCLVGELQYRVTQPRIRSAFLNVPKRVGPWRPRAEFWADDTPERVALWVSLTLEPCN